MTRRTPPCEPHAANWGPTSVGEPFAWSDTAGWSDGTLEIRVEDRRPGDHSRGFVPAYECGIYRLDRSERVGDLSLRVETTPWIARFAGHIGYTIDPPHRGHRFAARACRIAAPLLLHHAIDPVWLTVAPDNIASVRTCELIGAEYVETVDLPSDCDMYRQGQRNKRRYRWTPRGA